jgi:superfamily I DNA/RNA helicase
LVEAIVERIDGRGADPESVLALTFSRKAAEQLRDRVAARLGRTTSSTLCATFHSFAYGLVRRYSPPELYADPLRLLSAAEQDVVLQQLLTDAPESVRWPGRASAAWTRPRCALSVSGRADRSWSPRAGSSSSTTRSSTRRAPSTTPT